MSFCINLDMASERCEVLPNGSVHRPNPAPLPRSTPPCASKSRQVDHHCTNQVQGCSLLLPISKPRDIFRSILSSNVVCSWTRRLHPFASTIASRTSTISIPYDVLSEYLADVWIWIWTFHWLLAVGSSAIVLYPLISQLFGTTSQPGDSSRFLTHQSCHITFILNIWILLTN